jgi:hypothetical protein
VCVCVLGGGGGGVGVVPVLPDQLWFMVRAARSGSEPPWRCAEGLSWGIWHLQQLEQRMNLTRK